MKYKISTHLIVQEFNDKCDCPLCQIKQIVEENTLHEFLNDAVMEDGIRNKVNKLGFCAHHFDMLYSRQNKLSLALQSVTRTLFIDNLITEIDNPKKALKQVDDIKEATSSCIVCEIINEHMDRYYRTIAEMFYNEDDFKSVLTSTHGFCLDHYVKLLENSKFAKSKEKDYLLTLSKLEKDNLKLLEKDLQWFCDKHDYRNREKPLGSASDVLPRTRVRYYGKITK